MQIQNHTSFLRVPFVKNLIALCQGCSITCFFKSNIILFLKRLKIQYLGLSSVFCSVTYKLCPGACLKVYAPCVLYAHWCVSVFLLPSSYSYWRRLWTLATDTGWVLDMVCVCVCADSSVPSLSGLRLWGACLGGALVHLALEEKRGADRRIAAFSPPDLLMV